MTVKFPNVAGRFYSGDPSELRNMMIEFTSDNPTSSSAPRLIIAPHAGHIFSGATAGKAYSHLKKYSSQYERVAVFSPTHYFGIQGVATLPVEFYKTPLGNIPIATNILNDLIEKNKLLNIPQAFEEEHALEVHLPFLQTILDDFQLIPLIVSQTEPEDIQSLIETLDNGKTLFVISTDLSHFHSHSEANEIDSETCHQILSYDYQSITSHQACGYYPLRGALKWAKEHNFIIKKIDQTDSGKVSGDMNRVVGYASFIITDS